MIRNSYLFWIINIYITIYIFKVFGQKIINLRYLIIIFSILYFHIYRNISNINRMYINNFIMQHWLNLIFQIYQKILKIDIDDNDDFSLSNNLKNLLVLVLIQIVYLIKSFNYKKLKVI